MLLHFHLLKSLNSFSTEKQFSSTRPNTLAPYCLQNNDEEHNNYRNEHTQRTTIYKSKTMTENRSVIVVKY